MAYSFTDHYRTLRMVFRIDGIFVGIGLGLLLLIYPADLLNDWGFTAGDASWPARIAGACLLGMGLGLLIAARERNVRLAPVVTAVCSNGLIAVVLLVAYVQRELANLTLAGYALLIILFVVCLITVTVSLPYVRIERRPMS
jgi:peptidoglycan/LPS O-acetylase OafA/YrhL